MYFCSPLVFASSACTQGFPPDKYIYPLSTPAKTYQAIPLKKTRKTGKIFAGITLGRHAPHGFVPQKGVGRNKARPQDRQL
jgi:hypothetical protein